MIEPIIDIEPLVNEVKNQIGIDFLTSDDFIEYCTKSGFSIKWQMFLYTAEQDLGLIAFNAFNDKKAKNSEAFNIACNNMYGKNKNIEELYDFICFVIKGYCKINNTTISLNKIKKYFKLLGKSDINELNNYASDHYHLELNYNSLIKGGHYNELIKKIDDGLSKGDFLGCNTCCYTLLEGILKCYCEHFNLPFDKTDDMVKLVGIVKNDLKLKHGDIILVKNNIYNLISNATHIVYEIRNHNSDSHYDGYSDYITSATIRDIVIMISDFLIKLMEVR